MASALVTQRRAPQARNGDFPNSKHSVLCPGVQAGGVTRVVSTPSHGFDFVVRNDVQLGSDTLTSRYLFNRNNTFNINDNGAGGWFRNTPALSQALLESWTHNFSPRMVNEARVSFSRLNVEFGGGLNPFEPVADQVTNAFTNISFQTGGGLSHRSGNQPASGTSGKYAGRPRTTGTTWLASTTSRQA